MTALLLRRERLAYRSELWSIDPHCLYCGRYLKANGLTLDHVVPISRGGTHQPENLVLACLLCNSAKRERTLVEWFADLQLALLKLANRPVISPEITTREIALPNSISPEIEHFSPPPKDA